MPRIHPEFASILSGARSPEDIRQSLLPNGSWHPYPTAGERDDWEALPEAVRHPLVGAGESRLGMEWPALTAIDFLQFTRNGNRTRYEVPHFTRRSALLDLVLAECAEGQSRFLDDIINGVWATLEESFWGVNAHNLSPNYPERGLPDTSWHYVDLFAAETGALLAWTNYLLGPALRQEAPQVPDRIHREIEARILEPYRAVDTWQWFVPLRPDDPETGRPPNNWNPWIHSNILVMTLLEEHDDALRAATVARSMMGIDRFLAGYFSDGGCDEGTSYWGRAGGSLFDCLWALDSASDGAMQYWDVPLIQEIARYIYRMHIGDAWYVNFADGGAKTMPDAGVLYRYGTRIGDQQLQAQASAIERSSIAKPSRGDSISRHLGSLFEPLPDRIRDEPSPLIGHSWLDGLQVLAIREHAGEERGLFLAAKGGNNDESHNHNDVGSFIVGLNGRPVVIDAGVETYSRKTFSSDRYEIWTMQSEHHNLPIVNGVGQSAGYEFAARNVRFSTDAPGASLNMDISQAYPPEAGITNWDRTIAFARQDPALITVADTWDILRAQSIVFVLMTSVEPRPGAGELTLETDGSSLIVSHDAATVGSTRIDIDDERLGPVWGEAVWRTTFRLASVEDRGTWQMTIREGGTPS